MRLIAEGDCYGHNAVFSEDPGGGFQLFPGGGQLQPVTVEQILVAEQPLPILPDGDGIDGSIGFPAQFAFGQLQFRVGGVDLRHGDDPAQDWRAVRRADEVEQHVGLVSGGKVQQNAGFPFLVGRGGRVGDPVAGLLLPLLEEPGVGVRRRIRPGENADSAQGQPLRQTGQGQKQSENQRKEQQQSALHGRFSPFGGRAALSLGRFSV